MFGKRPRELTRDDIQRAVDEQWQEGSQLELKGALPAKKGLVDPWSQGNGHVGDKARDEILAELVAFANAYGGWLVLGVEETDDKPKRAKALAPIRECVELAERFRHMCRDCIDPRLPILEIEGVPLEDDGAGVVAFHVPHSRMAPHRLTPTKECYRRHADRTEKMTMREIQDLTLQIERGMAAIEAALGQQRSRFADTFRSFVRGSQQAFGLRATAIPTMPLFVERVHGNRAVGPPLLALHGTVGSGGACELAVPVSGGSWNWRPILRGTRSSQEEEGFAFLQEVHSNGLIEYRLIWVNRDEPSFLIFPDWVMGLVCNVMCAAEMFRRVAGAPDAEYLLEFEVTVLGEPVPVRLYGHDPRQRGPFPTGTTLFPHYSLGPREEFRRIATILQRDFWDAAGVENAPLLLVDFAQAFRALRMIAEGADAGY